MTITIKVLFLHIENSCTTQGNEMFCSVLYRRNVELSDPISETNWRHEEESIRKLFRVIDLLGNGTLWTWRAKIESKKYECQLIQFTSWLDSRKSVKNSSINNKLLYILSLSCYFIVISSHTIFLHTHKKKKSLLW